MKILVTGVTGFLGRAFCFEAVRRGHRLLALTRDPGMQTSPGIEIARGSLEETPWEQVAAFAPEAALHLAWIAEPGVYLNSPENEVWLHQSKAWFQRLFDLGVPYVAGTGTCIEYAASNSPLVEERSPLGPLHPYSKAKVALFEWLGEHAPAGWAWFRVFFPYGAGEHAGRYTSQMVRQMREGKKISMNTPDSIRDYIEVTDAATAFCHAIEAGLRGAVNIGTGTGVSIGCLARQLASLLGADENLLGRNPAALPDSMPCIVADTGRLKASGWQVKTSLAQGLQRLIDSLPPQL